MRQLFVRYAILVVVVLGLNFILPRLLPGDPLDALTGDATGSSAAPLTESARAQLRSFYHLDQPLAGQFAAYAGDLARADLGWSISRGQPVARLIGERLPWTLALVLGSVLVAGAFGILLGSTAAWRAGRIASGLMAGAIALAALPEFLVATSLLLVFSVGLGWFPLFGGRAPFGATDVPGLVWHAVLPALTLVVAGTATFALLAHGTIETVRGAAFVIAARAKGLSETRLAMGHALPNALPAMLALFGVRIGHVLGGALVVERVFALPGLGLLAFDAVRTRDYPVLQTVFLLGSLGVLLANFVVDCVRLRGIRGARAIGPPRGTDTGRAAAIAGAAILVIAFAAAVLAPALAPYDPRLTSGAALLPPSAAHPLGTNDVGQDLLSALLFGARGSLSVAALVAVLATASAWAVGIAAGLFAVAEGPLMAFADLLLALPALPLYMLVVALVGPSFPTLVLVLGLLAWPAFARIVRADVHALRTAPHVEAAWSLGATRSRVAVVHVLPLTLPLLPMTLALTVRYALYAEATLAFLGLGDPATFSWGTQLGWAFADPLLFARGAWVWWVLPPAACIVLVVLGAVWCASRLESARWNTYRQVSLEPRSSSTARRTKLVRDSRRADPGLRVELEA